MTTTVVRCGRATRCDYPSWQVQHSRSTDSDSAVRDLVCTHCGGAWSEEIIGSRSDDWNTLHNGPGADDSLDAPPREFPIATDGEDA